MSSIKIYNTPFEVGVRALMIINKYDKGIDLDSIIILDYLSLHANVVNYEFKSLHPDNPFHGIELFSKRNVIKESINLLIRKGLIDIEFSAKGILYVSNSITEYFLSFFEGKYFNDLNCNIDNIVEKFKSYTQEDLQKYINNNLETCGGQIIYTASVK